MCDEGRVASGRQDPEQAAATYMVPSAGLEPAWVTPYAPQTYVSTNSTTTARREFYFLAGTVGAAGAAVAGTGATEVGAAAAGAFDPAAGATGICAAAGFGAAPPAGTTEARGRASRIVSTSATHDERHEAAGRQLVQNRRRAAGAEGRLRAAAAEGSGDVRSLALLDEHHEDQEEADEGVQDDQGDVKESHGTSNDQ